MSDDNTDPSTPAIPAPDPELQRLSLSLGRGGARTRPRTACWDPAYRLPALRASTGSMGATTWSRRTRRPSAATRPRRGSTTGSTTPRRSGSESSSSPTTGRSARTAIATRERSPTDAHVRGTGPIPVRARRGGEGQGQPGWLDRGRLVAARRERRMVGVDEEQFQLSPRDTLDSESERRRWPALLGDDPIEPHISGRVGGVQVGPRPAARAGDRTASRDGGGGRRQARSAAG